MEWVLCGSSELFTICEESDAESQQDVKPALLIKKNNINLSSHTKVSKELEVDYESSCTALYSKLEQGQWACVVSFLESGYWPDNLFAVDPSSPLEQARTWVTRHDAENPNKIRWSQLPIHLALVVGAPFGIVRLLIGLYPESIYCADDESMLPLHLAMRYGSSDKIVDLLLACYPDAINVEGKMNRTPLECALRGEDKIRGRILRIFVEGSKAKTTKAVVIQCSREVQRLKKELQGKERQLVKVREKLCVLDENILKAQSDLTDKIDKLKTLQKTAHEKTDKKITELEASKQLEKHLLDAQIELLLVEELERVVAQQKAVEEAEIAKGLKAKSTTAQFSSQEETPKTTITERSREVKADADDKIAVAACVQEFSEFDMKQQNADPALRSIRYKLNNLRTARAVVDSEHAREVDKLQARLATYCNDSTKKIEALEKAKLALESELLDQMEDLKAVEQELETEEAFKTIEMRLIQSLQDEPSSVCSGEIQSKDPRQSEAYPKMDEALKSIETRFIRSLNDKSTKKTIRKKDTADFKTSKTNSKDEKATVDKIPRKIDVGLGKSSLSMSTTVTVDTRQDGPTFFHDITLLGRALCMGDFNPTGVFAARGLRDDNGPWGMNAFKETYLSLCRGEIKPQDSPFDNLLDSDNTMLERRSHTTAEQTKVAAEHPQQNSDDCLKPENLDPEEAVAVRSNEEDDHQAARWGFQAAAKDNAKVLGLSGEMHSGKYGEEAVQTPEAAKIEDIHSPSPKDTQQYLEREVEEDNSNPAVEAQVIAKIPNMSGDGIVPTVAEHMSKEIRQDDEVQSKCDEPVAGHSLKSLDARVNSAPPKHGASRFSRDHDVKLDKARSTPSGFDVYSSRAVPVKDNIKPAQELAHLTVASTESTVLKSKPSSLSASSTGHALCAAIGNSDSNAESMEAAKCEGGLDGEIKVADSKLRGQAASLPLLIMDDGSLVNARSTTGSKNSNDDDRTSIDGLTEEPFTSGEKQTNHEITREDSVELELSQVLMTQSPTDEHKSAQTSAKRALNDIQQGNQIEQTLRKRTGFRKFNFTQDATSTRPPLFHRALSNRSSRIKALNADAKASIGNDRSTTLLPVDSLSASVKQGKPEELELKLGGQKEASSFAAIVERTKASLGNVSDSSSSHDDSVLLQVDQILSMISNAEISKGRVESDLSDSDDAHPQADEDETRQDEPCAPTEAPPIVITFSGQSSQIGPSHIRHKDIKAQCSREESIEIQFSTEPHIASKTMTTTNPQSDKSKTHWQKYVKDLFRSKKHKEQSQKMTRKSGTIVKE